MASMNIDSVFDSLKDTFDDQIARVERVSENNFPRSNATNDPAYVSNDPNDLKLAEQRVGMFRGAEKGNRNDACFKLAANIREHFGVGLEDCIKVLIPWAKKCEPEFPISEIRLVVGSVYGGGAKARQGEKHPRAIFASVPTENADINKDDAAKASPQASNTDEIKAVIEGELMPSDEKSEDLPPLTRRQKNLIKKIKYKLEKRSSNASSFLNEQNVLKLLSICFVLQHNNKACAINPEGELIVLALNRFVKEHSTDIDVAGPLIDIEELTEHLKRCKEIAKIDPDSGKATILNKDDEVANITKSIINIVYNEVVKYLEMYHQRTMLRYSVDMFAVGAKLIIEEKWAHHITPHKPCKTGPFDQAIVDDYQEHYPGFEQFLVLLVASRFASDRRMAFF